MSEPPAKRTFPCPKCNRTLVQSGEINVAYHGALPAGTFPTFQCDECLVTVDLFGATEEVALTFALGADGQPFDPAAPDGRLRF